MKKILLALVATIVGWTAAQAAGFDLANKKEGLMWSSLPASISPNLTASRANAMAGMSGGVVPIDRNVNPAAWYQVPEFGLKGYDPLTTTFGSWLGEVPGLFPNERGHRLVLHVAGTFPVSKYKIQVISDTAMVTGGDFEVGRDSVTKAELAFGPNFIGVAFGANKKLDSSVQGSIFTKGGDDTVFNSGQLPSAVTYDVWFRFGSSTVVNITDPSGFVGFKNLPFSLTAKLLRDEAVVVTAKVSTVALAPAKLSIVKTGANSTLTVEGGGGQLYNVKTNSTLGGAWSTHIANVTTGSSFVEAPTGAKRFYRLERKPSAMLASAYSGPNIEIVTSNGDDDN